MRYEGKLIITLKSDLCVGSGYSYAGLIDSDICFDKYGIPYIPARRLKGCLKQSAEDYLLDTVLSAEDLDLIFGVSGDNGAKGIRLNNAYPAQYDSLYAELEAASRVYGLTSENVLKAFSHIQGQTRLVEGVAQENSLRYTRVLNRVSPIDGKEMTFTASFSMDNADGSLMSKLEAVAGATRNIGLKRNRGMGSVQCRIECKEVQGSTVSEGSGEEEKVITYTIQNTSPLMLSNASDTESIKYIPGQMMLGFLAGSYLREKGETSEEASEDQLFADLFINGCTKYSNLLPSSDGKVFVPAPAYIKRLKSTGKYVNVIDGEALNREEYVEGYSPKNGNQPKRLEGKFVYMDENRAVEIKEVDTEMVYHHSNKGKSSNGENGILYSLETIEAMQEFTGEITAREKYVPILEKLLKEGNISLGKSKSAQYGACRLVSLAASDVEKEKSVAGTIVVTLCSDAVFLNERGEYTVYADEIYDIIARDLGIENQIDREASKDYPSIISTREIVGYQSTWNLRRMPVPGVCAGSCVIYPLKESATINNTLVGERVHEGFGRVRIDDYSKMKYEVKELSGEDSIDENKISIQVGKGLLTDILIESVMDDLKLGAFELKLNCSSSSLGRITLMLKESLAVNKDPEEARKDFKKRIDSIKTESVKTEAWRVFKQVTKPLPEISPEQKKLMELLELSGDSITSMVEARWGEYAMKALTSEKYRKSAGKRG